MKTRVKNLLTAGILMLPVWTYFHADDPRFWLLTIPCTVMFASIVAALPVFYDRLPRRDGR